MRIQIAAEEPNDADDHIVFRPDFKRDERKPVEKYNVLLVEDDFSSMSTLRAVFRAYGCFFSSADSLEKAMEMLDHQHFDLVVTNRATGGQFDGVDVLKKAKKANPNTLVSIFPDMDQLAADEALTRKLSICVECLDSLRKQKG
jgi:CheY-like chemotaxis protein